MKEKNTAWNDRMKGLTQDEIQLIHDATMQILEREGICFNSSKAINIFRDHGFQLNNKKVIITEKNVRDALETVPSSFKFHARNQDTVPVGKENYVLLPSTGAPNVTSVNGKQRSATMADFKNCCDLVQTSKQLDMGGWLMVQPNDVPPETAHLDMMLTYLTRCNKPFLGAFGSETMAEDTIEMAKMVFKTQDYLMDHPVTSVIINALSPLQFSEEMTDVMIKASEYHQPLIITNMALAGSTAPVRLPGLMAVINAEILAGLVLSQLVGEGTPVVYGTTSGPMDMKTSVGLVGAWETAKIASMAIQMAQYYDVPCRAGGALNDSQIPDAQAAAESSLLLSSVIRNGANFILHACGQMASYMSMSFEKWLIDEEICSLVKSALAPVEITPDTIDLDTILEVGSGGQYLTHQSTFQQFKSLSQSMVFSRNNNSKWQESGGFDCARQASEMLPKRLSEYEIPSIDQGLKQELEAYVSRRKQTILQ